MIIIITAYEELPCLAVCFILMQSQPFLPLLMYGGEILNELQSFIKISGRMTKFYENFLYSSPSWLLLLR
jgi:hypothetical protein